MTELDSLVLPIDPTRLVILDAENIRAGHVTLSGLVIHAEPCGFNSVEWQLYGRSHKTVKRDTRVVVLGDLGHLSLAELSAGQ